MNTFSTTTETENPNTAVTEADGPETERMKQTNGSTTCLERKMIEEEMIAFEEVLVVEEVSVVVLYFLEKEGTGEIDMMTGIADLQDKIQAMQKIVKKKRLKKVLPRHRRRVDLIDDEKKTKTRKR
eukprot:TRINITY_DN3007_c0_g1_i3.p3 TRINITY_DN3007_c0_g1~~TRINITY_DN3007_c0_g1_i3.p3  ORF type:complete len:126 (+),score=41.08 TRINITY_DN3007_c0_g1_i3:577-954(+)